MLSDAQKVDCRRICGYPAFGQTVNPASGYRFMVAYGALEYRLINLTANEEAVVTAMLATLTSRESEIGGAAANLDTDAAAVWKHNRDEVRDRTALYRWTRLELCNFFGVPPGPALGQSGAMIV